MASPRIDYGRGIREIRNALATATWPLTLAEIAAACPSAPTTIRVGTAIHAELTARRAVRTGTRGSYRYTITAAGRAALDNPNSLRSGRHRRTHGRRNPRLAEVLGMVGTP